MAMDIEPTPATVVVTTEQPLTCNALWGDKITIDAGARNMNTIGASVQATPYLKNDKGDAVAYAKSSITLKTTNLVAVMQRVPEVGVAFGGVEAGIVAWHRYMLEREADLANATTRLEAAKNAQAEAETMSRTTVEQAKTAVDAAAAARVEAFKIRKDKNDPVWVSADDAWKIAVDAYVAAVSAATNDPAVIAAREVTAAAEANVKIAQAAAEDPANPPLIVA